MRNLFILHLPLKEPSEIIHYNETIINRVQQAKISPYLSSKEAKIIKDVFDDAPLAIWRLEDDKLNREKFEKLNYGDEILIVEEDMIKFMGKIVITTDNYDLSKLLWPDYSGKNRKFNLIFIIFDLVPIDLPFYKLAKYFGYSEDWIPDGLTLIPHEKMQSQKLEEGGIYRLLWRMKEK